MRLLSILLGLLSMVLCLIVVQNTLKTNQSEVVLYNQWINEIILAKNILVLAESDSGHSGTISDQELSQSLAMFENAYGRISGATTFSTSADDINTALANLCFELDIEYRNVSGMANTDSRGFLISQLNQVIQKLPNKISNIGEIQSFQPNINSITENVKKNYEEHLNTNTGR